MQNQARCDIMLLGCLKHYLQRVKFRLNRSGVPPLERFFFLYVPQEKPEFQRFIPLEHMERMQFYFLLDGK